MEPISSILYQNSDKTAFLIDIPASIALAQHLGSASTSSQRCEQQQLYSSPALTAPYPGPPEPKSETARSRLLARIPVLERNFHQSIEPFIREGLDEIRHIFGTTSSAREWCFPRKVKVMSPSEKVSLETKIPVEEPLPNDDGPARKRQRREIGLPDGNHKCKSIIRSMPDPEPEPPLILGPSTNEFASLAGLRNIKVKNPSSSSSQPTNIRVRHSMISSQDEEQSRKDFLVYTIPPLSSFILGSLQPNSHPIPGLSKDNKFNLIVLDPPWPNRSVRRSAHYATHPGIDGLTEMMKNILRRHLYSPHHLNSHHRHHQNIHEESEESIVGIWTTNKAASRQAAYHAIQSAGLIVSEEWVWVKTTSHGEPVSPVEGLWRKPYEVFVIGRQGLAPELEPERPAREGDGHESIPHRTKRRLIAGVPDIHSRKPNLRELFEDIFFSSPSSTKDGVEEQGHVKKKYTALEVFARSLTAGWCSCGDDVLKFNSHEWWASAGSDLREF